MNKGPDRDYFQNWWTAAGIVLSIVSFAVLFFLIIVDLTYSHSNPYLEAFTYLIFPAFLVLGLTLIPFGAFRERKKRHLGGYARKFPQIDLNNPRHQKVLISSVAITTLFILFSCFGVYRAYEFTESVQFCGMMCHNVMHPEYTAYQNSPHARVACTQCHIGPGAGWYVRSKLSGMYQIYSAFANKYSRPIETPVKNLRPAQETCEQCHWPQHFYGAIEQRHHYFLPDEKNTEWKTRMLMFVGGGTPPFGRGEGIHWHMNIKNKIYYVAEDEKRLNIPWVKSVGPDGSEKVYVKEGAGFSASQPPKGEMRKFDCIDCHNRPSHIYNPPVKSVNEAMEAGEIDKSLPFIKREAVNALIKDYKTSEEGQAGIRSSLQGFYEKEYPEVLAKQKTSVDRSIEATVKIFKNNFFPEMKVSWKAYPNHIGHLNFEGCFRCHDGLHKTKEGTPISNSCTSCHIILEQGPVGVSQPPEASSVHGVDFIHPEDVGDAWKDGSCTQCHTGELA